MAEALVRKSTIAVKREGTYGTDPTATSADVIDLAGVPTLNDEFDEKERTVIKNTLSEPETIRGAETTSGELPIEPKGSGTAGTSPDADVLWESAVGVRNTSTASTTHAASASTTTTIELVASGGASFAVGDAIYLPTVGTGEVTWITAIATDQLTVSPALSVPPGLSVSVGAGVHYKLTVAALKSFFLDFWRGDITREKFGGNIVESLALNFNTGDIITSTFGFQGQQAFAPVTEAYGLGAASFDATLPLVATSMVLTIGAVSTPLSSLSVEIANELFRRLSMTTAGTQSVIGTKRTVSGSFSLFYEDKAVEDAFRADTKSELRVVAGSTPGNIFCLRLPKVKYTAVPKSDDSGIYKYDVSWKAISTIGEDELTSISFL